MHIGLEGFAAPALYGVFWIVVLMTIFRWPVIGIYYLIPLIPAQTLRDSLKQFPLGANVVTIVMIAVTIGLIRQGRPVIPKSLWRIPVMIYIVMTFFSLIYGSFFLGRPLPFFADDTRLPDWRNYVMILFLAFLVHATVETKRQMQVIVFLICVNVFLMDRSFWNTVGSRDYSSYSEDLRGDAGAVGYAGVNGLAAFEASIAVALLALAEYEKKFRNWAAYVGLAIYSAVCLTYSLSRGGYIAFLIGCIFLGLVKSRKLLIVLVVFGMTWTAVVPNAVVERVLMTHDTSRDDELDHSSETRLTLWEDAMQVFQANPVTGTGFDTYAYMGRVGDYRDTHNIYVKVLVETGVVGLAVFLFMIYRTLYGGLRLARRARDPFYASLGLALASWLVCTVAANFFGDRWSYLQVNGYMWVLIGLVARATDIEDEAADAQEENSEMAADREHVQLAPA